MTTIVRLRSELGCGCTYCLRELFCGSIQKLFHQANGQLKFLVAQAFVGLPVENLIHFREAEILESEDAFDVVISQEDAVHSTHAHLKRILQHSGTGHVVKLSFKRLPLTLRITQLIAEAFLVLLMVHANRHYSSCLQVENTSAGQTRVTSVELRAHQDASLLRVVEASRRIAFNRCLFWVRSAVAFKLGALCREKFFEGVAKPAHDVGSVVGLIGIDCIHTVLVSQEDGVWSCSNL